MGLLQQIAPIVAPVGGVVSGLIQNIGQKKQQERAFEHDVEMWNQANYYNSPEQQMSRLEKAGLNPNLVYGNGSVVGNTSTATPHYQAPNLQRLPLEMFNPLSIMGQYMDLKQKSAQIDLTNESINAKRIENGYLHVLLNAKADGQALTNAEKAFLLGVNDYSKDFKTGDYNVGYDKENSPLALMNRAKLRSYSANYANTSMRTDLMNFEKQFMESVPKQYQWIAPLILRLLGK